jgi:hypothetical protein
MPPVGRRRLIQNLIDAATWQVYGAQPRRLLAA